MVEPLDGLFGHFNFLENLENSPTSEGTETGSDMCDETDLFPGLSDLEEIPTGGENKEVSKPDEPEKGSTNPTRKKYIRIKMGPNQEAKLLQYLSQNFKSGDQQVALRTGGGPSVTLKAPTETVSVPGIKPSVNKENAQDLEYSDTEYSFKEPTKCMSKAAIQARENRVKKKRMLHDLQGNLEEMTVKNHKLRSQVGTLQKTVKELTTEVEYLRSVLANQSTLSSLLKNIGQTPGVTISSSCATKITGTKSVAQQKRPAEIWVDDITADRADLSGRRVSKRMKTSSPGKNDHDYATGKPATDASETTSCDDSRRVGATGGGVCLHVSGKSVSLEFCAACSEKARLSK